MVEEGAKKPPEETPAAEGSSEKHHKKRKILLFGLGSIFLLAGIAIFLWWLIWGQFEESTEDAYVGGNMVEVTPQVSGIVSSVNVDDTFFVKEGETLVNLDLTDPILFFENSKTQLANTVRNVVQMFENVVEYRAEAQMRKAELIRAQQDYENRVRLVGLGGVSKEEFEHVTAAFRAALGSLEASYAKYKGSFALVENTTVVTHPLVEKAQDLVKEKYVALQRTSIQAPASGIVAKRGVQVGQSVTEEDPLLAIIPLNQIWVDANFKEVHLKNIRIGQPVKVTADMYGGDIVYQGIVMGIAGGTGSVFSVLPPQNATGNWIKIVQRLPVRISLNPEQVKRYPLRIGLSMEVTVDTHDRKGSVIPVQKPLSPLYYTDIYAKQIEGAGEVIDEVIKNNLPNDYFIGKYADLADGSDK